MSKPQPSIRADWMDAVIAAGHDPRDLPEDMLDLVKRVFDFGGECAHCEYTDKEPKA